MFSNIKLNLCFLLLHPFFCLVSSHHAFADSAKEQKVLICGVCKNTADAVPNTINNIEALGSRFADYAVIIYENNSTDNTAALYAQWAQRNHRVEFISENLNPEQLSSHREVNIARGRNIVLSVAKNSLYHDFKYLIMVDLDFTTPWPIDEIANSIELPIEWDCISANGVRNRQYMLYWDRYAFRNSEFPLGDELLGTNWWKALIFFSFGSTRNTIPVYSAFGGLAIYKTAVVTKYEYSGTVNHNLSAYYSRIIAQSNPQNGQIQEYISKSNQARKMAQPIPIIFGHTQCCEHVTLHAAMALDGHDKFFVNPALILDYKNQISQRPPPYKKKRH